jgi:hypothetical protein
MKQHVQRQQLVASAERDSRNIGQAIVLLNAYADVLLAFERQRDKISIALEPSRF